DDAAGLAELLVRRGDVQDAVHARLLRRRCLDGDRQVDGATDADPLDVLPRSGMRRAGDGLHGGGVAAATGDLRVLSPGDAAPCLLEGALPVGLLLAPDAPAVSELAGLEDADLQARVADIHREQIDFHGRW